MPREWLTLEQYKEYVRRKKAGLSSAQVPPEQGLLENVGSITDRVSGKVVPMPNTKKPPTQIIGARG